MAMHRLGGSAQQIAEDIKAMFDQVPDDNKKPAAKATVPFMGKVETAAGATDVEIGDIIGKTSSARNEAASSVIEFPIGTMPKATSAT